MQDVFSPTARRRALTARSARWAQTALAACALAACGGGGGGGDAAAPPSGGTTLACPAPVATVATTGTAPTASAAPAPSGAFVVIGTATYDFVPTQSDRTGLDYANTVRRPIRGATVELLGTGNAVLATTTTDELGRYGFGLASAQTVTVRVRAELKRSGASGGRDFTVRDNTSGETLYALDSTPFTLTAPSQTVDVNAPSGWGGNGYTGPRAAAPFAILDVVYAAQLKVASADGSVTLPPLKLFWSPNNQPVDSNDPSTGNIGTSFFASANGERVLYLLGKENTDTDEYDSHIVAHEFGHYLQSALSRDDSVGGVHSLGDRLDMRVAFSEGWGNAWSGMVLGSPIYSDSVEINQSGGFFLDVSASPGASNRGSYSEASAQYLLWTTHQDAAIGFGPVYAALRSLAAAPTFSSLYSFAAQLKAAVPAAAASITSLWNGQQIVAQDSCGTGETNAGGNAANLPIYKQHTAALGVAQNHCVNSAADPDDDGNKLGRHVFILFAAEGARTLTATRSGGTFAGASDPDLVLVKSDGSKQVANVEVTPTQALSTTLPTGTHVLALEDFNLTSPSTSCFNLTVN